MLAREHDRSVQSRILISVFLIKRNDSVWRQVARLGNRSVNIVPVVDVDEVRETRGLDRSLETLIEVRMMRDCKMYEPLAAITETEETRGKFNEWWDSDGSNRGMRAVLGINSAGEWIIDYRAISCHFPSSSLSPRTDCHVNENSQLGNIWFESKYEVEGSKSLYKCFSITCHLNVQNISQYTNLMKNLLSYWYPKASMISSTIHNWMHSLSYNQIFAPRSLNYFSSQIYTHVINRTSRKHSTLPIKTPLKFLSLQPYPNTHQQATPNYHIISRSKNNAGHPEENNYAPLRPRNRSLNEPPRYHRSFR